MYHFLGPSQYTCVGQNVTGATGTFMPGKTDNDVEAMYSNQRTTYIPMNFSSHFPNLVTLNIENGTHLYYIDQITFKNQLKFIQLDEN